MISRVAGVSFVAVHLHVRLGGASVVALEAVGELVRKSGGLAAYA